MYLSFSYLIQTEVHLPKLNPECHNETDVIIYSLFLHNERTKVLFNEQDTNPTSFVFLYTTYYCLLLLLSAYAIALPYTSNSVANYTEAEAYQQIVI